MLVGAPSLFPFRYCSTEPAGAALLGHEHGLHKIQGTGDGFVPAVLDTSLIEEVIAVTDDDAVETAKRLAAEESALLGTSSGRRSGRPQGCRIVWVTGRMSSPFCPIVRSDILVRR